MALQLLEFGYTAGQTLTAKLFAIGSDTVVQTATAVTEATNRTNRYVATFDDVPAGDYLLNYFIGAAGMGSETYTLTLTTATFQPDSETSAAGAVVPGDKNVNFTVSDDSDPAEVVPGAKVTIQTSAGVSIAGKSRFANTNGVVTIPLSNGDYKALVTASGYDHTAESFSVDEDDDAVALTATSNAGAGSGVGWLG